MVRRNNNLTRFLYITTLILLILGIPVSAIYWWAHSWAPGVWYSGYWGDWIRWVLIASAVLVSLWILDLIMWIRNKREKADQYRKFKTSLQNSSPPSNTDFTVDEHGQATYVKNQSTVTDPVFEEGRNFISNNKYHNEFFKSETDSTKESKTKNSENDARINLMKGEVNYLVEEGKLTTNEAIKLRHDIENSIDSPQTYLDTKHFLQAIRHRPSK
jgi:hypothetical protein